MTPQHRVERSDACDALWNIPSRPAFPGCLRHGLMDRRRFVDAPYSFSFRWINSAGKGKHAGNDTQN